MTASQKFGLGFCILIAGVGSFLTVAYGLINDGAGVIVWGGVSILAAVTGRRIWNAR